MEGIRQKINQEAKRNFKGDTENLSSDERKKKNHSPGGTQ